jgi:ribosomal protein S27AE
MTIRKAMQRDRNREKLMCPACGSEMNLHAEKLREPRTVEEAASVDPALDGLLIEHHTCPSCGRGASRPRR